MNHLAFHIQALSIPPLALLLWQLSRAVPGRFLALWTAGWFTLAAALLCRHVNISPDVADLPALKRLAFSGYCCLEYVFGFLLWAGCRNLTADVPLRRDVGVLLPPLAFGAVAPWFFEADPLYVFHAPIFGMFFLLALAATRGYRASDAHPALGIRVVRGCLLILGVLFVHYGPVTHWAVWMNGGVPLAYMHLSSMYDALAEVGLAFGMAMVAIEQVRDSLEQKNRELAAASEQLAVAARTDALTGLLNRRAFDAMLKEWDGSALAGAVAVIDLNNLKQLNDDHGHAAGDAAIQLTARAIKGLFRITDPVFRTGGDEFVVVLEGGRAAEMSARMATLDEQLRGQRLPDVAAAVDLTAAWGLADFASPAEIPAAMDRADKLMYACKAERKTKARA
jgi:diguanylate cyclase (GGDEF)-like protein